MDKETIYNDLASILKDKHLGSRVLVARGEQEADLLSGWACRERQADKEAGYDDLKTLIEACDRCPGIEERKFGIGTGVNRLMLVLNSPQLVNNVEKKVLKKESVELLKRMVQAAGLAFGDCYITNLVKCEVRDPLARPSQLVKNCEPIITREIEIIRPRVIIVFGDIIPLQKTIKESTDIFWYNIDHPITIIKNPELKRPAWSTLKLVMAKLKELNLA
ncbi:MAG: hypothetical protein JW807_04640 [Spirochaetes bacterium]|nr:hypothetical protein [Spirochaetota bacterium]